VTDQPGQPGSREGAARLAAVMAEATGVILARIAERGWPIQPGQTPVPWDINRGWCVDWAEFVAARVPGAVLGEHDDGDMLHTFVRLGGRCYDAECPDGAAEPSGLPCFVIPYPERPAEPKRLNDGATGDTEGRCR
jgi:hypothetical protein